MKGEIFKWHEQIKWETFEWECEAKQERDILCNMLSTNHRKFGEQFPSIFIPKFYRANTKGTNPKRQRERAKRAVQNGSNSRMILQEAKNHCVSLQEENHVRYPRKETLCQVQLQEDGFLDGFLDMDFLGSSLVFCLYEEKQKKDWPMMMGMERFPRLRRNSAWQTSFAKCLPFVLWEREWRIVEECTAFREKLLLLASLQFCQGCSFFAAGSGVFFPAAIIEPNNLVMTISLCLSLPTCLNS